MSLTFKNENNCMIKQIKLSNIFRLRKFYCQLLLKDLLEVFISARDFLSKSIHLQINPKKNKLFSYCSFML